MGDKYRKNTPQKTTRKTKTKALWSGQLPHPSQYPLQPRLSHTAVHPDMAPQNCQVYQRTHTFSAFTLNSTSCSHTRLLGVLLVGTE